jgi:hypothetical protein
MYNFSNYIHTVRFAARDHNEKCIAKVKKFLNEKSRVNAAQGGGGCVADDSESERVDAMEDDSESL